ncbi:MAG: YdbC family protein [Syntrophomonadaceae bacterium]|jgi:hypothetical protein
MADLKYQILKHLGVLSEGSKGWKKEINLISWGEHQPKIDIRDWGPGHERVGKGITLNQEELKQLKEILEGIDLDTIDL